MTSMETLISEKNYKYNDRWHPHAVDSMETLVSNGIMEGLPQHQMKNIAYSLQYLQFLDLQIKELCLHSVIKKIIYKNYVVTCMSIIEVIFHHILKSIGKWRKIDWKEERKVQSTEFEGTDGKKRKYVITTMKKLDIPEDDEMTFDSIINKIQASKIFESKDFPYIKKYKKLRNRVHLQIGEDKSDTDYFNFAEKDYLWAKYLLYTILSNPQLDNNIMDLDFLCLNGDEKKVADIK